MFDMCDVFKTVAGFLQIVKINEFSLHLLLGVEFDEDRRTTRVKEGVGGWG